MKDAQQNVPPTELAAPPLPLAGGEMDRIPERIGAFRILDLVARGMATVYKAEQERPRRLVALKIPRGGRLIGAEARQRFLREVELAARLHHSSIVPVLEVGEVDGVPFYTMPFIDGRSLAGHIASVGPTRAERLRLFLKICDVVQALHAEQLVHRDLKPENVLIDRFGDVRLLDFGLARALAEDDGVSGHQVIGTLQYMAPEQTEPANRVQLTTAADVYALGMMLYQLLTDQLPYQTEGGLAAAVSTIRTASIAPPSRIRPDLGEAYDAVIRGCLAKEASQRPRDAAAVAAQLRAVLQRRPVDGAASAPRRTMTVALAALLVVSGVVLLAAAFIPRPHAAVPATPVPPAPVAPVSPNKESDPTPPARLDLMNAADGVVDRVSPGGETLPKDLWSAYAKAESALRDRYELRRFGAVLIQSRMPGDLSWAEDGKTTSTPVPVDVDQVGILYAPPGRVTLRWSDGRHEAARVVTVQPGVIAAVHVQDEP